MKPIATALFLLVGAAPIAFADESGLRIERPQVPLAASPNDSMSFTLPAPAASHWVLVNNKPVFCGVLLCGGSCQHRGADACTLRTFKDMLRPESAGCCAKDASASHDAGCGGEDACCH